jgi:hypothetical protein
MKLVYISGGEWGGGKKKHLKAKIDELETKSKIKNVKDLYRIGASKNIVKDGKGDLVRDSHNILARWGNHFSLLFNVHWVIDVR